MTISIIAHDEKTGRVGIAVASKFLAVGARNAFIRTGVGAIASQAFFNPTVLPETGIDPVLKYLASDGAKVIDNQLVYSVRNFLFGPPGAGGFDLASLNIQRGRDHGLADYNTTREAFGMPRVTSFDQISSNPETVAALQQLYGSVDDVDLWVGGLAEDHAPNASVGPLFSTIIADQFTRIRDGEVLEHTEYLNPLAVMASMAD